MSHWEGEGHTSKGLILPNNQLLSPSILNTVNLEFGIFDSVPICTAAASKSRKVGEPVDVFLFFFWFSLCSSSPMCASIAWDGVEGFPLCASIPPLLRSFHLSFLLFSFFGVDTRRSHGDGISGLFFLIQVKLIFLAGPGKNTLILEKKTKISFNRVVVQSIIYSK